MNDNIDIKITTSENAYVTSRNGHPEISEIVVWMSSTSGRVSIEGISRSKGFILNAGFHGLTAEEMDKLCVAWLSARAAIEFGNTPDKS